MLLNPGGRALRFNRLQRSGSLARQAGRTAPRLDRRTCHAIGPRAPHRLQASCKAPPRSARTGISNHSARTSRPPRRRLCDRFRLCRNARHKPRHQQEKQQGRPSKFLEFHPSADYQHSSAPAPSEQDQPTSHKAETGCDAHACRSLSRQVRAIAARPHWRPRACLVNADRRLFP